MKFTEINQSRMTCSECGGPAFSTLILAEKHDACYNKVKSRYKVWPSAYASGALVQCRKKGAANWGNKNEGVAEGEKSPMFKDAQKADRIRSLKNLIAIAREQGRQLRVQELELELKKLQGVTEMDSQGYTGSRDRKKTSKYGSRDHYDLGGPESTGRPLTAKQMMDRAHKAMLKSMSNDEKVDKGWRNPNVDEGTEQVYNILALDKGNALKKPTKLKWKASSLEDIFDALAAQDWYPLEINGVEVIAGKRLKPGVAEGNDDVWGPQGNFAGDKPVDLGGSVSKRLGVDDTVTYFGEKATILAMSKDRTVSRIHLKSGITQNVKTADLKRVGQGMEEANSAAQQAAIAIAMKKAGKKPVDEDYNPEYDDEAGMADNNLETMRRAVEGIDDLIDSGDNLPEWCQEKIAVAKSMLVAVWDYMRSEQDRGATAELTEEFDLIESIVDRIAAHNGVDAEVVWEDLESLTEDELYAFAVTSQLNEDWSKVNKQDRTAGMSRRAVKAYRRENPGSKLQTAVTTKPSKLKKGSKASKRRKSYCSRSRGQMKMHNISCAKTPDKAICKARRRWNC